MLIQQAVHLGWRERRGEKPSPDALTPAQPQQDASVPARAVTCPAVLRAGAECWPQAAFPILKSQFPDISNALALPRPAQHPKLLYDHGGGELNQGFPPSAIPFEVKRKQGCFITDLLEEAQNLGVWAELIETTLEVGICWTGLAQGPPCSSSPCSPNQQLINWVWGVPSHRHIQEAWNTTEVSICWLEQHLKEAEALEYVTNAAECPSRGTASFRKLEAAAKTL